MGKVLLYASIAVTFATAALGFINKGKLTSTKDELASAQQQAQQKTAAIEKAQVELKKANATAESATTEKAQAVAEAEAAKTALEKAKKDSADLETQIKAKTDEAAKLAADLEEAKTKAATPTTDTAKPAGPSAEDQAKMAEQETLITKLQGDLESSRTQLEGLRKEKQDRLALKMRNGLEGRILAVNQAWNFVVLNLGDKNGVVGNAEMLIKRGNQLVGKVRVTSVEPSTSIADIVASSVPRGVSIQPGDNVIYQATAE
jgi:hypothetical protein